MTTKSHVSMETRLCVVCAAAYDTGAILLDKRLQNSMEPHTLTGMGMCPECQKMKDDGYIALVAIDPERSATEPSGLLKPQGAYRTGRVAHIRAAVWPNLFDTPVPEQGLCYTEDAVIDLLGHMQASADDTQ